MPRFPILIVLGSWSLFCAGVAFELWAKHRNPLPPGALFALAAVPWVIAKMVSDRSSAWLPALRERMERHTEQVDALPQKYNWLWIALAAGTGLYLELVLIRFHASCFQLFAFFKNFSLLSCFLGLGIGYALGNRRPLFTPVVLPLLAFQAILLHVMRYTGIEPMLHNPIAETLALGLEQSQDWVHAATVYGFLFFVFSFNALLFIPLGHLASRLMDRAPRLVAYSWNLVGSLAGILAFFALSFIWSPPALWLGLGALAVMVFLRGHQTAAAVSAVALVCVVGLGFRPGQYDLYSPYQILSLTFNRTEHPTVNVNHVYFQKILRLDTPPPPEAHEDLHIAYRYYNLPYVFKPSPQDVLIVGAGTGNDVAAAVRSGAEHIDAVEIDPAILWLGHELHPESPYQSPAVRARVNDARAHIRNTDQKYDLIVFGLLDSHTLLSNLSGVRLDSYIYTVEALKEARARLKDDGVICLTFVVIREELGRKLHLMLSEAFDGRTPLAIRTKYDGGVAFIIGNNTDASTLASAVPADMVDLTPVASSGQIIADVSTDDWPFFYMPVKSYPVTYAIMVAVLLAVSFFFVRGMMPLGRGGFSAPCFLLGAGFMLLETKAITELALFYGSTWVVVAVVIAAILTMAFLANLLLIRLGSVNTVIVYTLLLASIAVRLGLDVFDTGMGLWLDRIVMTAILTLPLFFAGLAFSSELKKAPSVGVALSSNLLGAMLGGCLEYNSMYFGYRSLYVLAIVLYALAFATSLWRRTAGAAEEAPAPVGTKPATAGARK